MPKWKSGAIRKSAMDAGETGNSRVFRDGHILSFSGKMKFASMARRYRSYCKPLHTVIMFSNLTENCISSLHCPDNIV